MHAITTTTQESQQALYVRMRQEPAPDAPLKDRIVFKVTGGAEIIDPGHVVYLKADSNYTEIHMEDGHVIVVSRTLKECSRLFPATFARPHQSYLVNPAFLRRYRSKEGYLELAGAVEVPVSRSGRAVVSAMLAKGV